MFNIYSLLQKQHIRVRFVYVHYITYTYLFQDVFSKKTSSKTSMLTDVHMWVYTIREYHCNFFIYFFVVVITRISGEFKSYTAVLRPI